MPEFTVKTTLVIRASNTGLYCNEFCSFRAVKALKPYCSLFDVPLDFSTVVTKGEDLALTCNQCQTAIEEAKREQKEAFEMDPNNM